MVLMLVPRSNIQETAVSAIILTENKHITHGGS